MRKLILILPVIYALNQFAAQGAEQQPMRLGVDADNWSGQIKNPNFEIGLRRLRIDFISWHIVPEEEAAPEHIREIVQFCRKNHWSYLFNTEVVNYRREDRQFKQQDGAFRYDVAEQTLQELKDDPLFLGIVYDEADLMQAMNGVVYGKGGPIEPYFVDTRRLSAEEAFLAVSAKVAELTKRYQNYGKRLIFEMVFPDYPFAYARGGALLAPKLLKENYNDLMYAVYRGAALEYGSKELWACADLWFRDKFPFAGKYEDGYHTPAQLLETLQFAYSAGFDFVYVEQYKGLLKDDFTISVYGEKLLEFQQWRQTHKQGDWRTAPIEYYVKRFPDGYWGQDYSTFIPDHPYGSWSGNLYRARDQSWFKTLHELSHDSIPIDADTWNATRSPYYSQHPYQASAGLPPMVVFDQFGKLPHDSKAKVIDLTSVAEK